MTQEIGKTMSNIAKRHATGFLAELLAKPDKMAAAKTRNKMLVAAKIDMALKGRGMSQKDFAGMMGKSVSEISEWLSGDRNFTLDTITEIEERLGVSLLDTSLPYTRVVSCACLTDTIQASPGMVFKKAPEMGRIPAMASFTDNRCKLKVC